MLRLGFATSSLILLGGLPAARPAAAQTSPPASAADSAAVTAVEREVWEALKRGDWAAFDRAVAGMTYVSGGGVVVWRPGMSQSLSGLKLTSYSWSDVRAQAVAPGLVLLTYQATMDQSMNGVRTPSPVYMLSLWSKRDGGWVAVAHSETPAAAAR
jgi:hypothetical protein